MYQIKNNFKKNYQLINLSHVLHISVCKWANVKKKPTTLAVPRRSPIQTRRCLTSVIGRELVLSAWYGRSRKYAFVHSFIVSDNSFIASVIGREPVLSAWYGRRRKYDPLSILL